MLSKNTPVIHALIVAAGTGSRYGGQIPKQYQRIDGKPLLLHTLARLSVARHRIAGLTLVLAATDSYADALMADIQGAAALPIVRADGGAERWQSVANGVASIRDAGAHDDDWVLIHDAARPCLAAADLMALIDKLAVLDAQAFSDGQGATDTAHIDQHSAAILGTPVVDTLKKAVDGQISHTVSRDNLWQALTPQAFRLSQLERVLALVADDALNITDEASAFEMAGLAVSIVTGSRMNLKLTYAEDLALITMILRQFFSDDADSYAHPNHPLA